MLVSFRKVLVGALVLLVLFCFHAVAHEVRTPVIVDTDMALDDARALVLMLNSPHVQIKGIVTSDGSASPEAGYRNVYRILKYLDVEDIPVGMGRSLDLPVPPWREQSDTFGWSDLPKPSALPEAPDAISLIITLTRDSDEMVTYVCLGPMTNLAEALNLDPSLRDRIGSVLFYGTPIDASARGWNTERDPQSVKIVTESGIPTYFLHLEEDKLVLFDTALLDDIRRLDSSTARLMDIIHSDERVQALVQHDHLWAGDETVALYIEEPSLGTMKKIPGDLPLFKLSDWDRDAARRNYVGLASGLTEKELSPRMPVVIMRYPTNPKDLREDVRILIPDAITRHGLEEWKATLLTNELHRHLGIYSIIGAKMGIRARELLGASLDEVRVESHAGLKPPLSCMNDGLQVSTGASLGRGTITTLEGETGPAAAFMHGDKMLRLSVKEEVVEKIRADIRETIKQYGALTPEYFKEIRRLSIKYWLELDRREIFDQRSESKVSSDQAGRVTK